ncbi:beta-N-acetylhexosaminidase [Acuticoccus sp. I52.16.1]|uniref:beta-N-acetylhexosaminidase n=1 Tax=Acuticoccus sp. I52.16.1 TaxID=2928472 RepID=UPI001FD0955C|nr:beta-N-acetylhexosaminidase [Acuticoccus sp. I52.16.1]UOM34534.1 beta-N-acetylhexosaminidase [Acuticoccus sp. I52.16.1]
MTSPLIVGLAGTRLGAAEADYLAAAEPLGIILFKRNIAGADEIARLVEDATAASGARLVLIDQEGGRVQRIGPPLAGRYPPARAIGDLYVRDPAAGARAAWLAGHLIAADLAPLGINTPCLPVADVPVPGAHDVIGDRAYAEDAARVAHLAGEAAAGVLAAGALPVVKHVPGHGRAAVDSHVSLPTVDAPRAALEADFAPFRALAGLPVGMTAHVVYEALDAARPATLSPVVVDVIRRDIGFAGLLMTDDISMGALTGDIGANAAASLAAGCDCVLHCNGDLDEMRAVAAALPPIAPDAARRLAAAHACLGPGRGDLAALREEFQALMGARAGTEAG